MIPVTKLGKCWWKRKIARFVLRFRQEENTEDKIQYGIKPSIADKASPPKDTFYLIYITFFLIGVLLLLPFHFFTTASHYWMYKFRNTTIAEITVEDRTWWQIEFASVLTIISQTTSMCFNLLVTLIRYKLNTRITILCAISMILILFVTVLSFIFVNTDAWQNQFFLLTMATVAGINSMKSFINISIYEVISSFPPSYLIPYLIGQGTAGIFSAVFQILSLAIGADSKLTAIIYFSSGIAFVSFTLMMFVLSLQTSFYKHHVTTGLITKRTQVLSYTEVFQIFRRMWTSVAIMGLVIFTVLPVYPAVASLVVSDSLGDGKWNDLFFVPVTTYFMYCISDVCGRITASKVKKKLNGPSLVIISLFRFLLFVPAVMMCNARPRRNLPVLFPHDWQYMIIIITFGASSGYLANVAYINVENLVPSDVKTDAFSLLSTSNGVILFLASFMGQVCVQIL
ncbi:equilibrative nucleoside transporter 3-like isoform X2 [Coccinella septempunctata]|uniref:equilibrative nucleoside transporter 3-like isoform X2 n=1 Tax=Coccinella septempunctata TaxID=41139 RepID=UPI001D05C7D6|nr:equilibrative nucleoside transporter 3-like isoform X2 [Coccinella septempunctata]